MGISLITAQASVNQRQDDFKMNELGGERAITIGRDNQIVKAEIMDAPKNPQHKPHEANKGLEGFFKATIDKCDRWHSAGKLRRAQDAIEVNLGGVAGKFVNLQALAGKTGLSQNIAEEKANILTGLAEELSAFKTEINSLVRSYGLDREGLESQFLQRLINGLKKNNPDALNRLSAAVDVMDRMVSSDDNPVMKDQGTSALVHKFNTLLRKNMPDLVAQPVDQRTVPQKVGDFFKGLFGTKEQRVKESLGKELKGLYELCDTRGPEMEEFTDQIRSLQERLTPNTELTTDDFEAVRQGLDTIIGETIKRGKGIAQDALNMEKAKIAGQLPVNKYQPQKVSAQETNRDLSKLFLYKNTTLDQAKSLQSLNDEKADDMIRKYIRNQNQSLEQPKGARAVTQIVVNSVNTMTRKFVAARQGLKSLEADLSAITVAKQLVAKGDTPPVGVDDNEWREACSVVAKHLLSAPRSLISEEGKPGLNLIKKNEAHFTEGLQDVALQRFGKLFTQLDAATPFTVLVPKPSLEQIETLKENGEKFMKLSADQFNMKLQDWHDSPPATGILKLNSQLAGLRRIFTGGLTLNSAKLNEGSLRSKLTDLKGLIQDIKSAYSYEMASDLSGISKKDARLDRRIELFANLKNELQGPIVLEAELQGMLNMDAMARLPSEGLDLLRQSCPKDVDRESWENDCNALAGDIMENPQDIPQETVASFGRLLDTFNASLTTSDGDKQKVELYNNLKENLNEWEKRDVPEGMGRDSLDNMEHMSDVLKDVSKMTTARIRISDMVNLMQDSFIALTEAGFPHADELRSNLSEYTNRLMAYADATCDSTPASELPRMHQEAQESLSKTIHSFFPAMEFLALQEQSYMDSPTDFTQDQTQKVTDLRATLFNAYTALSDIARNVGALGSFDAARDVSSLFEGIKLTEEGTLTRQIAAIKELNTMNTYGKMSRVADQNNPLTRVTNSMMQESKAKMEVLIQMDNDKQTTRLFTQTRRLTAALVEAKGRGLNPALARSIERMFSEHVLSPVEGLQLDRLIPDNKTRNNFISQFGELHQALMQSCSTLQSFNLNVKSTQARINIEAQNYLKENVKIPHNTSDTKSLKNSLRVVASHDIDGKMSRILIESSLTKEPRWYDVSLNKNTLTFTPADDKSGRGVFTAPVSKGDVSFPKV